MMVSSPTSCATTVLPNHDCAGSFAMVISLAPESGPLCGLILPAWPQIVLAVSFYSNQRNRADHGGHPLA